MADVEERLGRRFEQQSGLALEGTDLRPARVWSLRVPLLSQSERQKESTHQHREGQATENHDEDHGGVAHGRSVARDPKHL